MIYIAGPMTGHVDWNYPAFNIAAAYIRDMDFEVINPAENFDGRTDLPWDRYLRRAVQQVAECQVVVTLPGWEDSKGARLEVHIAKELGLAVLTFEQFANLGEHHDE